MQIRRFFRTFRRISNRNFERTVPELFRLKYAMDNVITRKLFDQISINGPSECSENSSDRHRRILVWWTKVMDIATGHSLNFVKKKKKPNIRKRPSKYTRLHLKIPEKSQFGFTHNSTIKDGTWKKKNHPANTIAIVSYNRSTDVGFNNFHCRDDGKTSVESSE